MQKRVQNFFLMSIITLGVSQIIRILFTKIMTNILTLPDYGQLALILSLATIFSTYSLLEIHSGLYRFIMDRNSGENNSKNSIHNLITVTYVFMFFSSIILLVLVLALYILKLPLFQAKNYIEIVIIAFIIGLNLSILGISTTIYTAKMESIGFSILKIAPILSQIIFIVLIVLAYGSNLSNVIFGILISNIIVSIFILLFIFSKYTVGKFSFSVLKRLLRYGISTLTLSGIMVTLIFLIQAYLKNYQADGQILAIFSLGLVVISLIRSYNVVTNYTYSGTIISIWEDKKDMEEVSKYANEFLRIFPSLFLIFGTLFYIFSPQIIILISNESYLGLMTAIPILLAISFIRILRNMTSIAIHTMKKPELGGIAGLISVIIPLFFSSYLINNFQLLGAWLIILTYEILLTILLLKISQKIFTINFQKIIFFKLFLVISIAIIFDITSRSILVPTANFLLFPIMIVLLFLVKLITVGDIRSGSAVFLNQLPPRLSTMLARDHDSVDSD